MKTHRLFLLSSLLLSGTVLSGCGSAKTYDIYLVNHHNVALSGVEVTLGDETVTTDGNGLARFSVDKAVYDIAFGELPDGYSVANYQTKAKYGKYTVVADSGLIQSSPKRGTTVKIGDLMYDYSFTAVENVTTDGKKSIKETSVNLADKLAENDFLILNFFYVTCTWCQREAPYVTAAYDAYKDCAYMIAVDDVDVGNSDSYITNAKDSEGLNFDVAYDTTSCTKVMNVSGYPTTVIIDRYGFICFSYGGAILSTDDFKGVLAHFAGEDYDPVFYFQDSYDIKTNR